VARKFFKQIKVELETNEELKALYPEVLWARPQGGEPALERGRLA
jgi:hypothetical protein